MPGPLNCKQCGQGAGKLYFTAEGGFCSNCYERSKDTHVYTGRLLWLGSEVYGKRLHSDELRVDTEDAMMGGSGKGLG